MGETFENMNIHQRPPKGVRFHLNEARTHIEARDYKKALKSLKFAMWALSPPVDPSLTDEAQELANRVAAEGSKRQQREAASFAVYFKGVASHSARLRTTDEYEARLVRIVKNVTAFALLQSVGAEGVPGSGFQEISGRIEAWKRALHPCFIAGYSPVSSMGKVAMSGSEQVRLYQLMQETVNEIVIEHASAVKEIRELREAVPGCLGYATVNEDIRAMELFSSLQRHAAQSIEMPSNTAMTTALLDAMEAAATAPGERELFKFVARGAFYVGTGAAIEDLIRMASG